MLYDVLVVGAGPAGAAAAKILADSGATVALVDGARFPRAKSCAGWLNAHAVRDFPFLHAARRKTRAVPFRRLLFHSPDLQATARYSSRSHLGYIVSRKKFDAALVRLAADAGAETFLGRKVVAVQAAERNVTLTLTSGRRLVGRLLVGADGAAGIVARSLGLRERWTDQQVVACLAKDVPLTRKQSADGFQGAIHVALGFGGASGYAWAFPGAGAVNVGIGVRATEAGRLQSLYGAWVQGLRDKKMLPKGANAARPSGAVIPAGAAIEFDNHIGKRTILVGDAGGFAAAATGEGIYPGIWSSSIAARSILEALAADRGEKKGTTCQDALLAFRSEWRCEMASYLQMPNVNLAFLLPLVFTNQEIADRFARAFLFGENL